MLGADGARSDRARDDDADEARAIATAAIAAAGTRTQNEVIVAAEREIDRISASLRDAAHPGEAGACDRADHPLVGVLLAILEGAEPPDGDVAAYLQVERGRETAIEALARWFAVPAVFARVMALVERPAGRSVLDPLWKKLFSPFQRQTYVVPRLAAEQAVRCARALIETELHHPQIHARNAAGHALSWSLRASGRRRLPRRRAGRARRGPRRDDRPGRGARSRQDRARPARGGRRQLVRRARRDRGGCRRIESEPEPEPEPAGGRRERDPTRVRRRNRRAPPTRGPKPAGPDARRCGGAGGRSSRASPASTRACRASALAIADAFDPGAARRRARRRGPHAARGRGVRVSILAEHVRRRAPLVDLARARSPRSRRVTIPSTRSEAALRARRLRGRGTRRSRERARQA